MISPDFAFANTAIIEPWQGRGITEESYGSPVTVRCRANFTARYSAGSTQATPTLTGSIWLPKDTQIAIKDRLTINGSVYEVTAINRSFDFFGNVNHIEAEVR